MSRSDAGYSKASGGGGGGPTSRRGGLTRSKWLRRSHKTNADFWVSRHLSGVLDVLGVEHDTDEAHEIAECIRPDKSKSKDEMFQDVLNLQDEVSRTTRATAEHKRLHSARLILDALSSASRRTERVDLDDGDDIGDVVNAMIDGGGWEIETNTANQYKKHVNICIDNSGSTHTAMTGFCAKAMLTVVNELAGAVDAARKQYPSVTYDVASYNKVAKMHTGYKAHEELKKNVLNYFDNVEVGDPTVVQARETHLSPLMELLYDNERERGIDAPIIDIILTDGEWESEKDIAEAAVWQSRRRNVTTYVLNLCTDEARHDDDGNGIPDIALPNHFRVIPLRCIVDGKAVDKDLTRWNKEYKERLEAEGKTYADRSRNLSDTNGYGDDEYEQVARDIRHQSGYKLSKEQAREVAKSMPVDENNQFHLKKADDKALHTAMMQIVTSELRRK